MIGRYKGKNHCPGCGRSSHDCEMFSATGICSDCSSFIRKGKEVFEAMKVQKDIYCRFIFHSLPKLYDSEGGKDVNNSITMLMGLLNSPDKKVEGQDIEIADYYTRTTYPDKAVIREDVALCIDALCRSIINYSGNIYRKGFREGSSVLHQLNNESISPADFLDKRKRNEDENRY